MAEVTLGLGLVDLLSVEPALLGPLRPRHTDLVGRKTAAGLLLLFAHYLVWVARFLRILLLLLGLRERRRRSERGQDQRTRRHHDHITHPKLLLKRTVGAL